MLTGRRCAQKTGSDSPMYKVTHMHARTHARTHAALMLPSTRAVQTAVAGDKAVWIVQCST